MPVPTTPYSHPTLGSMRDQILTELGLDRDSTLVQDVKLRLLGFANTTIKEIVRAGKWEITKEAGSITTVDGTSVYSLPANCDGNKIVNNKFYIISQQRELIKRTDEYMVEKLLIGDSGLVADWRPYGKDSSNNDQMQFYPTPNAAFAGLIINFEYFKKITKLAVDADCLPFDEELIKAGTLAKYLDYDEDVQGSNRSDAWYTSMVKKALAQNQGAKRFTPKFAEDD